MPRILQNLNRPKIVLNISLLLYLTSIFIAFFDKDFTYRYFIFWLHIFSISIVMFFYVKYIYKSILKKFIDIKELAVFAIILTVCLFISFLYLQTYPYVSLGDELRDAGLDAMRIYNGTIKNFSGYGNYNGYGEIVPVFASFFYRFFGSTNLTYRFPAAIISCIDVAILYVLLRLSTNKIAAFVGALTYSVFPLHMFYARTELVVIFDSFWASMIFLVFYLWQKNRKLLDYALIGITLGIAANFHTVSRILAALILVFVVLIDVKNLAGEIDKEKFKNKLLNILLLIVFCFVGFGPMLLYSNSTTFLQSNRSMYSKNVSIMNYTSFGDKQETLKRNYAKSLMVWFYENTTSRFAQVNKPILTPVLSIIFIIGIAYAFFILKKSFFNILILLIFIIPFTNSAMTDWVNADHRLMPLLTIGAIFIGIGFSWIVGRVKYKRGKCILFLGIILYLIFQSYKFFTLLPANLDKHPWDYLSMNIIYHLKSEKNMPITDRNLCIFVSPINYQNYSYVHYREQYKYFLPERVVSVKMSRDIKDNEAYIFEGSCSEDYKKTAFLSITHCSAKKSLYCPMNYSKNIILHY